MCERHQRGCAQAADHRRHCDRRYAAQIGREAHHSTVDHWVAELIGHYDSQRA